MSTCLLAPHCSPAHPSTQALILRTNSRKARDRVCVGTNWRVSSQAPLAPAVSPKPSLFHVASSLDCSLGCRAQASCWTGLPPAMPDPTGNQTCGQHVKVCWGVHVKPHSRGSSRPKGPGIHCGPCQQETRAEPLAGHVACPLLLATLCGHGGSPVSQKERLRLGQSEGLDQDWCPLELEAEWGKQ